MYARGMPDPSVRAISALLRQIPEGRQAAGRDGAAGDYDASDAGDSVDIHQ